jgi:hypothetical protein
MSKNQRKRTSFAKKNTEDEKVTRVVQFIDDPKNSSALAKIHEMSNKAKGKRQSPTHFRHIRIKEDEPTEKDNKGADNNFNRRKAHFATVKHKTLNILPSQQPEISTKNNDNVPEKKTGKNNSNSNLYNPSGDNVKYKTEYVWDKSINRLVEKKVPLDQGEAVPEKKPEPRPQPRRVEQRTEKVEKRSSYKAERKVQPKKEEKPNPKPKYNAGNDEIKEESQKEEKEEIIEKLMDYRKKNEGVKKKISYKIPKGNEKYSEVVYEKKILGDDEDDDDDFEKEVGNSKNTKVFKKIIKNEPGSKVIITKKVIEESSENSGGDKLQFDNDSDDDEDFEKEFKEFDLNPTEFSKQNVKVKVVTEEYDEKGNKIYSKEYTSNKLPKDFDKFS